MSESEQRGNESPLLSERGVTTISDTVVSSLAGMAAQEVEGVHMGGGASRTAGGVLGSITGSESQTSGISVEVGRTEVAIDLKMGIEYNKNILQTVDEVRQRITDRVESTTGLRIKELNATITDITFPEKEARRSLGRTRTSSEPDESPQETSAPVPETQTTPEEEVTEPETTEAEIADSETADAETTQAETTEAEATQAETTQGEATEVETADAETISVPAEDSRVSEEEEAAAPTGAPDAPEEEVTVEGRPLEEGETTEVRAEDRPVGEDSEAEAAEETQTLPEPETPEERMRRRAQERARRRRRRTQDS